VTKIGHIFGSWLSCCPWLRWCRRCGLIALKNERTEKAMKAGCEADDD